MASRFISVPQQQRVDVLGTLGKETKHVWLALHGYGQLVEYFKRHFRELETPQRAFVLPQGANKFYLQGTEGRVGASWMTKEDRLADIENQRLYLSEVVNWVQREAPNALFHMVGFSQGVATGMRFLGYGSVAFKSLLAWAGSWPPDLDEKSIKALQNLTMHAWFGDDDPYVTPGKVEERTKLYNEQYKVFPVVREYAGAHRFDATILAEEIARLEQLTTEK